MTETTLTAERLIGRFGMVASVVDCLLDANGAGALILGDAGVGKTALTNEVLFELGNRVRPFYVYAGPSLAEVPYAALAPLLTSLTPGQTDQPRAVLKALVTELNPEGQRDPSQAVLVVEDAHHLDDSSAAVIAQLAAAEAARVVLLCRPHTSAPPEVLSMWSEGLVDRFELQPLTSEDIDEALHPDARIAARAKRQRGSFQSVRRKPDVPAGTYCPCQEPWPPAAPQ